MSTKTASFMRWHANERNDDDILRHPADSMARKSFDEQHILSSLLVFVLSDLVYRLTDLILSRQGAFPIAHAQLH